MDIWIRSDIFFDFFRIIILAGAFNVIFTGLKRSLGAPTEFNKITFDSSFMAAVETFDLTIPIHETIEGAQKLGTDCDDINLSGVLDNEDVDNVAELSGTRSQHLQSHMDKMKLQSQQTNISSSSQFGNISTNLNKNRVEHQEPSHELKGSYKRVSLSGDDDAGFIPVSCLNTFTHDWAIKVRVTKKYAMRSWNNPKGQGDLFNVDLIDRGDCQINATFFNEGARKYHQILEEGKVYKMSGGQIKMANKRYTTIKNDYCITFDERADIFEVEQGGSAIRSGTVYQFTGISDL